MTALLTPPVARPLPPTVTALALTPSAFPTPHLWTRQEFEKLHGTGLLEGRRAFLLQGIIYEEGPMDPPHATSVRLVTKWLDRSFPTGHDVRTQVPLDLGAETEPLPDVALVRGSVRDYTANHPTPADVVLIVEVADTSLFFDQTTKAELYAAAGVAEYWVLDVPNRRLTVMRQPTPLPPGGYAYLSITTFQSMESVAPLAAPNGSVLVSDLLP